MIPFSLREGARNLKNLGITGLLTLLSLTLTLVLAGLAVRGFLLLEDWSRGLLGRFEIEAFLRDDVDSTAAAALAAGIQLLPDVGSVTYISKTEAARRFTAQFGDELFNLMEYNPLPPSLVVTLSPEADPADAWEVTARSIGLMEGVDDVVYQGELLAAVRRFYRRAGTGLGVALALLLTASFAFTILTVHGSIRSHEDLIRIILLSGGSRGMARGPFIALGGYYGLISGLIAAVIVAGIFALVSLGWGITVPGPIWWLPGLLTLGLAIGVGGAGWAAGRRIRSF